MDVQVELEENLDVQVELEPQYKILTVSCPYIDDKTGETEIFTEDVKVSAQPKKCSKCNNRRHKGFMKRQRGYSGPVFCKCLMPVLYFDKSEMQEQMALDTENLAPVDFAETGLGDVAEPATETAQGE